MRWQHLYELIAAQAQSDPPEGLVRVLVNRALVEFQQRTWLLRARAQLVLDGTALEVAPPNDFMAPLFILDENGKQVPQVSAWDTLMWDGLIVWHYFNERIVLGKATEAGLVPVSGTYTLEYARRPVELTGDPDQEVDIPDEYVAAIESRVLEHFSVAIPQMLAFHHARWRDIIHRARTQVNLWAPGYKHIRLPELL